jgi:hypothetical protein
MRTVRCPDCSEPVAAFAESPAGLPFAHTVALAELDEALLRHARHCVAVSSDRPVHANSVPTH